MLPGRQTHNYFFYRSPESSERGMKIAAGSFGYRFSILSNDGVKMKAEKSRKDGRNERRMESSRGRSEFLPVFSVHFKELYRSIDQYHPWGTALSSFPWDWLQLYSAVTQRGLSICSVSSISNDGDASRSVRLSVRQRSRISPRLNVVELYVGIHGLQRMRSCFWRPHGLSSTATMRLKSPWPKRHKEPEELKDRFQWNCCRYSWSPEDNPKGFKNPWPIHKCRHDLKITLWPKIQVHDRDLDN